MSQEIADTLSVEEVIERGLSRLVSTSGFDVALARTWHESAEGKFYGVSSEPRTSAELEGLWTQLGTEFEQCFWECRNAWFVEDVAAAPELALAADNSPIKALAVLPLAHGGPLRAAITLTGTRIHPFSTDEKQFLQAMAALNMPKTSFCTIRTTLFQKRDVSGTAAMSRTRISAGSAELVACRNPSIGIWV